MSNAATTLDNESLSRIFLSFFLFISKYWLKLRLGKITKGKVNVKMCESTGKYESEIVELKTNPSAIVCEK